MKIVGLAGTLVGVLLCVLLLSFIICAMIIDKDK